MDLRIEVAEAIVLKPGDRALLLLKDGYGWTRQMADDAMDQLNERFPDVTFALVAGAERVVVEATCQDNGEPLFVGALGSHLHECERERGHRSRVHRCKCGTEWWITDDQVEEG